MSTQYLTEKEIFETARSVSEGMTQQEIADHLDCTQSSVSKMLNGESKMISLAIRWMEMHVPAIDWHIETDSDGKPVRYFKAVQD